MNRLIRASALAAACALWLPAQTNVSVSETPAPQATEVRLFRDGSNNTEYICTALATNVTSTWTRSAATSQQPNTPTSVGGSATLTSVVVSSNVGTATTSADHGMSVGQIVVFSGATVDTDLNGTYRVASVGSSTTFTFTTASVADATYNEATLTLTTRAPRTNANVWAIVKYYTTTGVDRIMPAYGSNAMDKSCTLRANYF